MAKKHRSGRPGGSSGRYTPPKPVTAPAPPAMETDDEFFAQLDAQDRALRARCEALLGDESPTDSEWVDADLRAMDGYDATDEELVAFWRTCRACDRLALGEFVELAFVTSALARGADPVAELEAQVAALDAE